MTLDFTHFVQMAHLYIPGYLSSPVNAIRPELDGMAYHYAYNYLFDAAGNIGGNAALFDVFIHPRYYMDEWSSGGGVEQRYSKPQFEVINGKLRIKTSMDFRLAGETRQIEIGDLPVIRFQWALNLLKGDEARPSEVAPVTMVVLMYCHEDLVEVEGRQMFKGMRYMKGSQLRFGDILPGQILTA